MCPVLTRRMSRLAFDEESAKQGSLGTVYAPDLVQMVIDLN